MNEALKDKDRPYDANQLEAFYKHIAKHGPVVSQHEPSSPSAVEDVGFEHYPSRIDAAKTAIAGIGKAFTATGRTERKRDGAEKAQRQMEVVEHLGERISSPRQETEPWETDHLREQIGWVGTGKFETSYIPEDEDETREMDVDLASMTPKEREEAIKLNLMAPAEREAVLREDARKKSAKKLSKAGAELLSSTKPPTESKPNELRPATRFERKADKRLDKQLLKRRSAASKSRWLSKSYPKALNKDYARLSRSEQRRMRKISKKIERLDKKAKRADDKFGEIARGEDWRSLPNTLQANTANKDFDAMIARKEAAQERRKEKVEATKEDLKVAARALGEEIMERHQASWDLTKEQAERVAAASMKAGRLVLDETVATAEFTAKGSKYTAGFYAEVAKGAADIYWQAGKKVAKSTRGVASKTKSKINRKALRK